MYTTSGAVSAIADLKQRNSENAAAFMDRVKIAVDMLNYNVPEAERNAAFRQGYAPMVVAQFRGGLQEDLRAKVFGIPNPPAAIEAALTAASAAEAEKTFWLFPSKVARDKVDLPVQGLQPDVADFTKTLVLAGPDPSLEGHLSGV